MEFEFEQALPASPLQDTAVSNLVFDDEPLDSLLYGKSSQGPSPVGVFQKAYLALDPINLAISQHRDQDALRLIVDLYEKHIAVPDRMSLAFTLFLSRFIPDCPCPMVVDQGISYEAILRPIFVAGHSHGDPFLEDKSGTMLYRWYETHGRYQEARDVIDTLLDQALKQNNQDSIARCTNNFGYEYLLERRWDEAEPYFVRSTALFADLDSAVETANGQANRLTCQLERMGIEHTESFMTELLHILDVLEQHKDWRQRKLLVLLARFEEQGGNHQAAIERVSKAIDVARDVQSKHRLEDQRYHAQLINEIHVT